MQNRGAWIFAGLGMAFVALLMLWMGATLDTKAPIRIDRVRAIAPPPTPTVSAEETAAREEATMLGLVRERARALAARAAAQLFPGDEAGAARCTFTGATPVHRDGGEAWWNATFSCVDPRRPGELPDLTSVSVRLHRDGGRWIVEE